MIDRNKIRNKNNRFNRYRNGFADKIGYWSYKMNKAIENLDQDGVEFAAQRLAYFVKRQNQLNEIKSK